MILNWFSVHDGLASAGRLPSIARIRERISASEILLLLFLGAASAVAVAFRSGLRIPGNSILFAMLPMVLGLALAPRRHAGFLMGAGALGTAALFGSSGIAHYGSGAFVSLCLIGPMLDFALSRAQSGWRLYGGVIIAGIVTNLLALFSRGAGKLLGLDLGTRPFGTWYLQASVTYTLCGAVVGLVAAFLFFQFRKKQAGDGQDR